MKLAKIAVRLIVVVTFISIFYPNVGYADPKLLDETGNMNMKTAQKYVKYYEPKSDDGWFKTYILDDGTVLQVSCLGEISVVDKGVAVSKGNVNLPTSMQHIPFVALTDGSWIIQGDELQKYFMGECIEMKKLSQEIGEVKKIIFYNKYNIIYVLSEEGNLYAIDFSDNKVYTMRENQDVRDFALTNFLDEAQDVQISILTLEDEWLYTMESRVGEWCHYQNNVLKFKEDGVEYK